ncbi:MAG: winged helix-turn-helix transcriptional regulator [Chloroflexia bacterium]|nr:winged helix-turn-helix transcriptional regulator [Chloroflexia bacterium]
MAGKKGKSEVDGIRMELQHLSEAVWALREHLAVQDAITAASSSSRRSPNGVHYPGDAPPGGADPGESDAITGSAADFARRVGESHFERGIVATWGQFQDASGTQAYRWELEEDAATLLAIDDSEIAQVLAAIGHRQRLAILKLILNQPCSAADLVASLNLGTTGAAYHHLNVLQAADLVTQEERGVYIVQPHRVSAIFAILAGVASASEKITLHREAVADEEPIEGSEGGPSNGVVPDGLEGVEKRRKRKSG